MHLDREYLRKAAPIEPTLTAGGVLARVVCVSCGTKGEWRITQRRPPPEILPKHFITQGWDLRRSPTCPECAKKRKSKMSSNAPTNAPSATANSDAARRNKRLVIVALEDYFDEAGRCYRGASSDKTVGDELGLAPAFVASVREEFFGKLAEPDDVTKLRNEVAAIAARTQAITEEISRLRQKNGWA